MASKRRATFPRLVPPDPSPASASLHQERPRDDIYTLKVPLLGSKPAIWRRFALPGDVQLSKLRDVLQIVMGRYGGQPRLRVGRRVRKIPVRSSRAQSP